MWVYGFWFEGEQLSCVQLNSAVYAFGRRSYTVLVKQATETLYKYFTFTPSGFRLYHAYGYWHIDDPQLGSSRLRHTTVNILLMRGPVSITVPVNTVWPEYPTEGVPQPLRLQPRRVLWVPENQQPIPVECGFYKDFVGNG